MATLSDVIEEKKKFFDAFENRFKRGVQDLFDLVPELEGLNWQQWTPGFNDGEPCEHTMGELTYLFSDSEKDEDGDEYNASDVEDSLSEATKKILDDFSDEFQQLETELYKIFGTNQEITIKRDGKVTVEDYDCGY